MTQQCNSNRAMKRKWHPRAGIVVFMQKSRFCAITDAAAAAAIACHWNFTC